MNWKDKLIGKKQKLKDQMQRGLEVTRQKKIDSEQKRAEKRRRKYDKFKTMKPGARQAISEGLRMRSNPMTVMKSEYERRKFNREQKYKDKKKE